MNRKETIIYLAGLVDGEGYVGIKKTKYARHCPSPTYHERIQIRMVEEKAIKLMKEIFGGNYYKETEHSKYSKRPLYCFAISDLKAANTCKQLLPYLVIKKNNAELILRLRDSKQNIKTHERGGNKGGRRKGKSRLMSPEILAYRENLYLACKKNNHSLCNPQTHLAFS